MDNRQYGYQKTVKVSGWHNWMQSNPLDNPHPNYTGGSHYRTLGTSDEIYIPKTSAQEYEPPSRLGNPRMVRINQINFESYPLNDYRLDNLRMLNDLVVHKCVATKTTYQDNFKSDAKKTVCTTCDNVPDHLLNRMPKCGFEFLPSADTKFMDDHLAQPSENRKKIDYLRQIRNASNIFFS